MTPENWQTVMTIKKILEKIGVTPSVAAAGDTSPSDATGSQKYTSRPSFSDVTSLKRWITICIPNFNEISQCMAEINLLPVSENRIPPYWNCTSGF